MKTFLLLSLALTATIIMCRRRDADRWRRVEAYYMEALLA